MTRPSPWQTGHASFITPATGSVVVVVVVVVVVTSMVVVVVVVMVVVVVSPHGQFMSTSRSTAARRHINASIDVIELLPLTSHTQEVSQIWEPTAVDRI